MSRFVLLVFLSIIFNSIGYSQQMTAFEMHNAIYKKQYDKVIEAIENGSDPLGYIGGTSGRRRNIIEFIAGKSKGGTDAKDLLSVMLAKPNSTGKAKLLATIRKYARNEKLSYDIWHVMTFLRNRDNYADTVTLKWIIDRVADVPRYELGDAVKKRYNPMIKYTVDRYGMNSLKLILLRSAVCSDSAQLVNFLVDKYGVYPRRRNGFKSIDVLETQIGCVDRYNTVIERLRDGGSKFKERTRQNKTLLQNAVSSRNLALIQQLHSLTNIDLKENNREGQNLLHQAAKFRKMDLLSYLVEQGVDVNEKDVYGKRPSDYAYEWDFESRRILGDSFSAKELNTVFLAKIALKNDSQLSPEERTTTERIIVSDEYGTDILQSSSMDFRGQGYQPNYKDLIKIAKENKSWYLFSLLYKNEKWSYKPSLIFYTHYKEKDASFFRYMIPLVPDLGEKLYDQILDRWSTEPNELIQVVWDLYIQKKDENGEIFFQSPDGETLLDGQRFEWIDDLFKGYAMAKKDGKYGFVNIAGEEIISFEYDTIYPAQVPEQRIFYAQNAASKSVFQFKNSAKIELSLEDEIGLNDVLIEKVWLNTTQYYIFESQGKYGLYKQSVTGLYRMIDPVYDEIKTLTRYHIAFRKGEKWAVAYMSSGRTPKLKFKYREVKKQGEDQVQVRKKKYWETYVHY